MDRNINAPTLALWFLGDYRLRFKFEHATETKPRLATAGPDLPPDLWVLAYNESWPTTVIRGGNRKNLPARGRFWVEPGTGRVLLSELIVGEKGWDVIVTVRYAEDDRMGHLVPVAMRERFDNKRSGSRVEGEATYTRFRRFEVSVEENTPIR